jgi:predicted DNA-binding protein
MTPRKTDQAQIAFLCAPEMAAKLKALSEQTMIPQSRLLRRALELLFEEYSGHSKPPAGKGRR